MTGANRGLGFEIAKQLGKAGFAVIIGAREPIKAEKAWQKLKDLGVEAFPLDLDVSNIDSVEAAYKQVESKFGHIDVLVNNAGIMLDATTPASDLDVNVLKRTLEVNTVGSFAMIRTFLPLMQKNNYGRIVNMSSTFGALSDMTNPDSEYRSGQAAAYRISKAALNAVTAVFFNELEGSNILINSMCPGWCATDMGGEEAPRSAEEGADTAVWLATLPEGGPNGGFFADRKPRGW